MSENSCPMGYEKPDCNKCPGQFGKEGLCDWQHIMGICPKINDCGKISAVLSQDLPFDELYAEAMRETCRGCSEMVKVVVRL